MESDTHQAFRFKAEAQHMESYMDICHPPIDGPVY